MVEEVQPNAFLMENVPGLVAGDRFKYLSKVIDQFEDLGFQVAWRVLNAAEYGVPQKRRRLFVVGLRNMMFEFPEPTHGPNRPNPFVRVRDVLPREQVGESNSAKIRYAKNPDLRPRPYDGHLFNGGGRAINLDEPCHTILAAAGGNKTHFLDAHGLVPEYHRHLTQGGKPFTGTLPGARRLTVRESALIQTFPEDMVFRGPKSAQYHQVGDAVPPRTGLGNRPSRASIFRWESDEHTGRIPRGQTKDALLMSAPSRRNAKVEAAVRRALGRVDAYVSGEAVVLPKPEHRRACDTQLETRPRASRSRTLFLVFYWLEEPGWDCDAVPIGARVHTATNSYVRS